nr:diacylglycerol kinase family lipid kinase [Anaerolineae bacterium]
MDTAKIIVNPYAGRWKAQAAIPDVERACRNIGLDYELVV